MKRSFTMKRKTIASVLSAALALSLVVSVQVPAADTIRVGSKDFTENEIVAELYALALEDAGYDVDRIFDIAGSVIDHRDDHGFLLERILKDPVQGFGIRLDGPVDIERLSVIQETDLDDVHTRFVESVEYARDGSVTESPIVDVSSIPKGTVQ